jgi:hypothetical protein
MVAGRACEDALRGRFMDLAADIDPNLDIGALALTDPRPLL